jgi:integrase
MKTRYRLIRRGTRGGKFYCVDNLTGKRTSLQTSSEDEAQQIVAAKNQALRQPALNLQIARAYLVGTDSGITKRTWQQALDTLINTKHGANQVRWKIAARDKAYAPLLPRVLIETTGEMLLKAMEQGSVSTNVFLHKLHNFCLSMSWLPWPLIPKAQWPPVKHKQKRAITHEEHERILQGEQNPEWHAYYQLLWHLGGSQTDMATLRAEDIDWNNQTIGYARRKTGSTSVIRFGEEVATILRSRPATGFLFPMISAWKEADRGKAFIRRCRLAKVSGVSLHCYRYAWAERAKRAGYPERYAQLALGHNSKAVHRAYARNAEVTLPPLEEYERKIIQLNPPVGPCNTPASPPAPAAQAVGA